jgi:LPS-assembly protein
MVFCPLTALAAEKGGMLGGFALNDTKIPWQLEADEVNYDQQAQIYVAKGRVVIWKEDKKLTADYVRYDKITDEVYAEGNVRLTSGKDLLTGSRMDYNLDTQLGTVEDGYMFVQENNFHIWGQEIRKVGESTYRIDKATITTCDGDLPDWKITGQDAKIDTEGPGTAKNVVLYARKAPLFYTPYLWFPSRKNRQTGLLVPDFGTSSRLGKEFNQPFYWAINDTSDATFYGYYMSERGIRWGGEYRYMWSENTLGTIMADYLHDQQIDNGSPETRDKWGYPDNGVDIPRTNRDRYWVRMSHRQELPEGVKGSLDLDIVSDQDYLRDFRSSYHGYDETNTFFKKYFSRQLDDYNNPVRLNRLNLNRVWPKASLNAEARWSDNVILRTQPGPNPTLQELPVVTFDAPKQTLLQSPFLYQLNSNYNNFWREDGQTGQRLDTWPRVFWPYGFGNYVFFEPSVGWRETAYYTKEDGLDHRELYDTRMDVTSEVYRIYDVGWETVDRIKHSIRPEIIHEYIPDVNQLRNPNFDSFDRIDNQNLITYSLTNTLTARTAKPIGISHADQREQHQADETPAPVSFRYNDILYLKTEQSYDLNKDDRPFSPIGAKLLLTPGSYLSVDASALWSVYDTTFLSRNVGLSLWDRRGDRLFTEYRYSHPSEEITTLNDVTALSEITTLEKVESIYSSLSIKATDRLTLFGDYEYNIQEGELVRRGLGFLYQAACWSFRFRAINQPDDVKYEFRIELKGLGGVGM